MKRNTLLLLFVFFGFYLPAQNYMISFTASGLSNTLDSVYIENQTQNTSLTISGNDTLHLYGTDGINFQPKTENDLKIYPNPFSDAAYIEFYSATKTDVFVAIYDATGKLIIYRNCAVQKGICVFEVAGLPSGIFTVEILSKSWKKASRLVSINENDNKIPEIKYRGVSTNDFQLKTREKNLKNSIQMPYNSGDHLLFVGYSGAYAHAVTDVPASSKTIDFNFEMFVCGNTYTDIRDGFQYPTVLIGTQCWMAKNLAYLPFVIIPEANSTDLPLIYVYGYDGTDEQAAKATINYHTYGVLYNWPAAMNNVSSSSTNPSGVQGMCPFGWHIPADAEWTQMVDFLGGGSVAGSKLKEVGTTHWLSPNNYATNESGFTALPGGARCDGVNFYGLQNYGRWWSATQISNSEAWFRDIGHDWPNIWRHEIQKFYGFSVRCVRD